MFYIISLTNNETLAITKKETIAELIAETLNIPCVIRWSEK